MASVRRRSGHEYGVLLRPLCERVGDHGCASTLPASAHHPARPMVALSTLSLRTTGRQVVAGAGQRGAMRGVLVSVARGDLAATFLVWQVPVRGFEPGGESASVRVRNAGTSRTGARSAPGRRRELQYELADGGRPIPWKSPDKL